MIKPLGAGLSVEVDGQDQARWSKVCREFADANLYQTWAYEVVRSGESNVSHLLLKKDSSVVAAAQARLVRVPLTGLGLAYFLWGPLWKRPGATADVEIFRQALRAVRAEYVDRRGLGVRIVPQLGDCDHETFRSILTQEGYVFQRRAERRRTVLVDIRPSLDELNRGLHQKWRYHLNKARKQNLEIVEGEEDSLFEGFEGIYRQMVNRKRLADVTDLGTIRKIQQKSMPGEKMRVFLCKAEGEVVAGGICSALGDTGIYLHGATSDRGTKTYGSYLMQWRMLEWVRKQGCQSYDLNGINPEKNPGGYQFKTQLGGDHGRDVHLLGQFDAYPNAAMKWLVGAGERFKALRTRGREFRARLS